MTFQKLPEVELQNISVKYATDDVLKNYESSNQVERSIVLNTGGHGFYMGYRFAEKHYTFKFFRRKAKIPWAEDRLQKESVKASWDYLKVKKLEKLATPDAILVRISVQRGFKKGFRAYESERAESNPSN
jgi:hypothetical protein